MSVGTLILRRFNGEERFSIGSAEIIYYKDESGKYAVSFDGETDSPALQTLPDTQSLRAKPNFEFTLLLPKIPQIALKPGKEFQIPVTDGDDAPRFCYVEHQDVENVVVKILNRVDLTYRVRIIGSTMDVNFYDGSKPPAAIEIEADFTLKI